MTQQDSALEPSAPLLAAQQRLLELRQMRHAKPDPTALPLPMIGHGRCPQPAPDNQSQPVSELPPHLGWSSSRVTAVLQQHLHRQQTLTESQTVEQWLEKPTTTTPANPPQSAPKLDATIKVYPDITLALLRHKLAASGRIWLLLRYLDTNGQGWIDVTTAREQLTHKTAPLRVCGWRQLRNLLAAGEGFFWQRQDDRLWLCGITKVTAKLQITKLVGRPVSLPLNILLKNIGTVRAHFYATFHSSRKTKPVARETLTRVTAVPARTQRLYDRRAKVQRHTNFALGPRVNTAVAEEQAWQQGQAGFHLTDYNGQQGPSGTTYLAWQLPNSYNAPHAPQPRGRQQRINRELADLLTQGTTGNNQTTLDNKVGYTKRYFGNGRGAVKAAQKSEKPVYWHAPSGNVWYWTEDN